MNKGVCNFYHYREVALAANGRYLEALSVVDNPAPAYRQVEKLTKPVEKSGRSHAGFNPAKWARCQALPGSAGRQQSAVGVSEMLTSARR